MDLFGNIIKDRALCAKGPKGGRILNRIERRVYFAKMPKGGGALKQLGGKERA